MHIMPIHVLMKKEDEDEAECRDPIPYVRDEKNKSRIIDM